MSKNEQVRANGHRDSTSSSNVMGSFGFAEAALFGSRVSDDRVARRLPE